MINSLDDLRKAAVKHILRNGPANYLLRHSLCKPWVASHRLDEMAWTDFKTLFFNFDKITTTLNEWPNSNGVTVNSSEKPLEYSDHVVAYLAAACHELLHVLWLHRHRGKTKKVPEWKAACEYAINYELGSIFGIAWTKHLGVMYPTLGMLDWLRQHDLPATTDNFYTMLLSNTDMLNKVPQDSIECKFCERAAEKDATEGEPKMSDIVKAFNQLPSESHERNDILNLIDAYHVAPQKIPWEMLLLGGIENAVNQETSWAVASRRHEMLPGWRHEKLLNFVWVLDVSPSINDEMKKSFMNTLQAGINMYQDAQHRIIFFTDVVIQDIMVSSGTNVSNIQVPYGGGTDLQEVWDILERDHPEYALVLTDLELNPVPKPTYTKVVWGIVGDCAAFDPDYGMKIILK